MNGNSESSEVTTGADTATVAVVPRAPERAVPLDAEELLSRAVRLEEAVAALRIAEDIRASERISLGYGRESSLIDALDLLKSKSENLRRMMLPVALGDEVLVYDRNAGRGRGETQPKIVTKVGRGLVYLNGETRPSRAFKLSDGYLNDDYHHEHIVSADMHRIRRDIAPKPRATK